MKLVIRRRVIGLVLVLGIVGSVTVGFVLNSSKSLSITAYFRTAKGLYVGDDVRILGVKVGSVTGVAPRGADVQVQMRLTAHTDVPAGAYAAIVAPSLVSGRYVQVGPIYTGGPTMPNHAVIPEDRTAIPVEWDDIEQQLTRIAAALAPGRGQTNGALSTFINAAAGVFAGNGNQIHQTLQAMAEASQSLSNNRGNLFATLNNLANFISAMNTSATQIKSFASELNSISSVVAQNRRQIGDLLAQSRRAVTAVHDFLDQHRDALSESVSRLTDLSNDLVQKQTDLANILHLAPTTLANFYNIYDPSSGALTGRVALGQTMGFANMVCQAMIYDGATVAQCQKALAPLLDLLNTPSLPVGVDPLNQTGTSNQTNSPGSQAPSSGPPSSANGGAADPLSGLASLLLGGVQ